MLAEYTNDFIHDYRRTDFVCSFVKPKVSTICSQRPAQGEFSPSSMVDLYTVHNRRATILSTTTPATKWTKIDGYPRGCRLVKAQMITFYRVFL